VEGQGGGLVRDRQGPRNKREEVPSRSGSCTISLNSSSQGKRHALAESGVGGSSVKRARVDTHHPGELADQAAWDQILSSEQEQVLDFVKNRKNVFFTGGQARENRSYCAG